MESSPLWSGFPASREQQERNRLTAEPWPKIKRRSGQVLPAVTNDFLFHVHYKERELTRTSRQADTKDLSSSSKFSLFFSLLP
jgi:hypothetical protein